MEQVCCGLFVHVDWMQFVHVRFELPVGLPEGIIQQAVGQMGLEFGEEIHASVIGLGTMSI